MILSDQEIAQAIDSREIGVDPYDPKMVQPASLDMRLDRFFRWYEAVEPGEVIDPFSPKRHTHGGEFDAFVLPHGAFVLASTMERVRFPAWCVGRIEGKSSLARMGIFIHITAGFMDPGFEGYVTLEIFNSNPNPVRLQSGMPICQMSFMRLGQSARHPYGSTGVGSKYQNQGRGPQESAYYKNKNFEVLNGPA